MRRLIAVIVLSSHIPVVLAGEELVSELEHQDSITSEAFWSKVRTASFTDQQRVRITAALLRESFKSDSKLLKALESSATFSKSLPQAAIADLVEYVNRATDKYEGDGQAAPLLQVPMREGRFDDRDFERVAGWLPGGNGAQRSAAIGILNEVPGADQRVPRVMEAYSRALESEQVPSYIELMCHGLRRFAAMSPVDERLRSRLLKLATAHDEVDIRLTATEALIVAGAGTDTDALSAGLLELLDPPCRLSKFDVSWPDTRTNLRRGIDALAALHQPPYPAPVVDAFIRTVPESLDVLQKVHANGQLSGSQVAALEQRAVEKMSDPMYFPEAYRIYDVVMSGEEPVDSRALAAALSGADTAARYSAGFRLRAAALRGEVSPESADAARRVVLDDSTPRGLRALAAEIFVRRGFEREDPVPTLVAAIEGSSDPRGTCEILGPAILKSLEIRPDGRDTLIAYASQVTRRAEMRAWLISTGLSPRMKGDRLTTDQERRLSAVAADDPDRMVQMTASYALRNFGVQPPLAARIESGELPHKLMFNAFIALLIATAILLVLGIIRFRRWAFAAWLGFSFWMLLCLGLAFLGMIGHNSLPPWRQTLQASLPLYVSFVIYASWLIGALIHSRGRLLRS